MDSICLLTDVQPSSSTSGPSKRKSDASTRALDDDDDDYVQVEKPVAKKPRTSKAKVDPHAQAKQLVQAITASPDAFAMPLDDATTRAQLVAIARYAAALEVGDAAGAEGTTIVKAKTKEQVEEATDKLRKLVLSQIRKQMTWKPSCKGGSAKWLYAGMCPDPAVFQRLMGLPAPATYKATKITLAQLYEILCVYEISTSIRYGSLRITSADINIKWNKESGEFKFSGTYGL